jgi:hypothetical protein
VQSSYVSCCQSLFRDLQYFTPTAYVHVGFVTCTQLSVNGQDMSLVQYFAVHAGLSQHLAALGGAVARDDATDKLNFRACMHGSTFPGVLEKVP